MKKLFLRFLLLAVPAALFLLYHEYRFERGHNNQYVVKKAYLEARLDEIEVLILGGSSVFYGIAPSAFAPTKAFNLAATSQTLYYDAELLKKYVARMPRLRVVIVGMPYVTLGRQLDDEPEAWRSYYYRYVYGLPHRDKEMALHVRNYSAYYLQANSLSFLTDFMLYKDVRTEIDSSGGQRPASYPQLSESMALLAPVTLARHHGVIKESKFSENIRILYQIDSLVRAHDARLILVTPPATAGYRQGTDPRLSQAMELQISAFLDKTKTTHLDFWADSSFSDPDFYDPDHLNYPGSIRFSRILSERIKL